MVTMVQCKNDMIERENTKGYIWCMLNGTTSVIPAPSTTWNLWKGERRKKNEQHERSMAQHNQQHVLVRAFGVSIIDAVLDNVRKKTRVSITH